MQTDRIEGIGHEIKGAFKEGVGKLIGDAKLQHDGANERHDGEAQSAIDAGAVQVVGIDTDRIVGIGRQLKGALTEGFGNMIGDPALEAGGRAERAAGKVQNAAGGARDEALEAHEERREPRDRKNS
jgi:uncharacterized protein YjbJ (UPF0337 family)